MTTTQDADSTVSDPTTISNTDSPYTTQGEDTIEVDTSSGAVTVTLATADADAGRTITIIDDGGNAASNNITVNTEGGETIDPDGDSSKTISVDHAAFRFESNGTNWNQTGANVERESVTTDGVTIANVGAKASLTSDQGSVSDGDVTQVNLDQSDFQDDSDTVEVDLANNKLVIKKDGIYLIQGSATFSGSANWTTGDDFLSRINIGGTAEGAQVSQHGGANAQQSPGTSAAIHRETSGTDTDVTLEVFHKSGSAETIRGNADRTYLEVARLG